MSLQCEDFVKFCLIMMDTKVHSREKENNSGPVEILEKGESYYLSYREERDGYGTAQGS